MSEKGDFSEFVAWKENQKPIEHGVISQMRYAKYLVHARETQTALRSYLREKSEIYFTAATTHIC